MMAARVAREGAIIVLTPGSRPEAALITYEDHLRFQQMREAEVLTCFDQAWARLERLNAERNEFEIVAFIEAARPSQRAAWRSDQRRNKPVNGSQRIVRA